MARRGGPRRGKRWQTGNYAALLRTPKDQGERSEVSVSVGRSRHVETPPSGLGTTGHGPEALRRSRAQRSWRWGEQRLDPTCSYFLEETAR